MPALRELGFDLPVTPTGAFYFYAGCTRYSADSFVFALDMLEHAGVAVTPGIDFGNHRPREHLRFAYTTSFGHLEQAVQRLSGFLAACYS